ncbi:lipase family protein [Arcanobacterium bovis]|uniref:lipase family protein n=1 Tax=Arcanobacterium bovis TaxID=2529275 RepID=UPI0013F16148|nr:lipase family protein [Arcanobacterium bovis]
MRKNTTILSCLALSSLLSVGLAPSATADVNQPQSSVHMQVNGTLNPQGDEYRPFYYDVPSLSDKNPGTLIRSEHVNNPQNPLGLKDNGPYKATRILYVSKNRTGKLIPVSGIVIESKEPWKGNGKRPLIAFAPGTQGVADKCAPSRQLADGIGDYEQVFFEPLLKKGYAVVITDYEGLGTPGMHTYMDRVSQGHAVLDSVRAARQLVGWDLSVDNPLGIDGYSQGGGASASAVEQADEYAPELKFKVAAIGAAPADLTLLPPTLDGTLYFLFEAFAFMGISHSYGIDFTADLNKEGKDVMLRAANACTQDLIPFIGKKLEKLTIDGTTVQQFINKEPYKSMLSDQHIGYRAPSMPVTLTHSKGDDVIPFHVGEKLAKEWSASGGNITFVPHTSGAHAFGSITHARIAVQQFEKVFGH